MVEKRSQRSAFLAPGLMTDDGIFGQVTPDKIPALLEKYIGKG
jgi:NADH:ubiquinone oxidoreductase subunit E